MNDQPTVRDQNRQSEKPLSVDEAAEFTGYRKSYIYKLMHLGEIPYYRPRGGKAIFLEEELRAFMLRGKRTAGYELAASADAMLCERG